MKIVSFFSYKGGAGRSTLAYNTIPILAAEHIKPTAQSPMIVIDTDIDSCGMTYLLNTVEHPVVATDENCVQTLLSDGFIREKTTSMKDHPFFGKLCPVGKAYGYDDNDAVLLIPAKGGKLIFDNSNSNYSDAGSPLIPRMRQFVNYCKEMNISAIFIDSAVGDNLSAVISNEVSNIIVCCMRPTRQFREGTAGYLKRIENNRISSGKHIIIVPNVVPTEETIIDNVKYPDEAYFRIERAFADIGENSYHNYHLDFIQEDSFGVPALDRFMWCEEILYKLDKRTPEEEVVLSRYSKLANLINGIEIKSDDDE